jgi:hypothetical protein
MTSGDSNRHERATEQAADKYTIARLELETRDLKKRLTLALAQVETYKARAIEECEKRMVAELKLDELKSRM